MSDAVRLHAVGKRFARPRHLKIGLKQMLLHPRAALRASRAAAFVALEDVSFDVGHGETFGVIGRNGAGKSTLLGLICGVLRPSAGRVEVSGRVSPLLELGAGFVPELDARENAELVGVLMGLLRSEVRARMDAILDFAGLVDAADQPLQAFSSGMLARLGFSVAVHSDPDVLLVDEVLSVGDAEFQQRCLERVAQLRRAGVTILFVSHDLEQVGSICDRAAWLERGHLAGLGPAETVVEQYRKAVGQAPARAVRSR